MFFNNKCVLKRAYYALNDFTNPNASSESNELSSGNNRKSSSSRFSTSKENTNLIENKSIEDRGLVPLSLTMEQEVVLNRSLIIFFSAGIILVIILLFFVLFNSFNNSNESKILSDRTPGSSKKEEIERLLVSGNNYLNFEMIEDAREVYYKIFILYKKLPSEDKILLEKIMNFYNRIVSK